MPADMFVFFGEAGGWRHWLMRPFTRLTHVAVGSQWLVANQTPWQTEWWGARQFVAEYPRLRAMVTIPGVWLGQHLPALGGVDHVDTALRAITRGRLHANDCVSDVSRRLRACGINVPGTIITPDQLFRHLDERYGHASL